MCLIYNYELRVIETFLITLKFIYRVLPNNYQDILIILVNNKICYKYDKKNYNHLSAFYSCNV